MIIRVKEKSVKIRVIRGFNIHFVTTFSVSSVSSVCPFRTRIRVIRAECGAAMHSDIPFDPPISVKSWLSVISFKRFRCSQKYFSVIS